ncbi:MAG: hypothetical protein ABI772_08795 [Bacteroidota bacterium]
MNFITQLLLLASCIFTAYYSTGKNVPADSVKVDYKKIYSYCLDGNVQPALKMVQRYDVRKLDSTDQRFKARFEARFKEDGRSVEVDSGKHSEIDRLFSIYMNYWKRSLLDNSKKNDSLLMKQLAGFFASQYKLPMKRNDVLSEDTLDYFVKKYITSFGYHTTGWGRTGKYYDLLVWKTEKDTAYNFKVHEEKIHTKVVFMTDFITLGWEEYATLGRAFPGGWATDKALFCVKESYDLNSESFLISYLCHEGRHFSDYKLFPKLESADLEYRGKLTELSLLKDDLYKTINFFIANANANSDNSHSFADYCVIRDLSRELFKTDFEKNSSKWEALPVEQIQKSAYDILQANTAALLKKGKGVKKFIKK